MDSYIYLFYTYIYKINTVNIQLCTHLECNIFMQQEVFFFFFFLLKKKKKNQDNWFAQFFLLSQLITFGDITPQDSAVSKFCYITIGR